MADSPSLRKLITFADGTDGEVTCFRVSVRGGATYCIKGPVCGSVAAGSTSPAWGTCPSKGNAAIANCLPTSPSYATGCVAPVDAHCVLESARHWECVFPATAAESASATAAPLMSSALSAPTATSAPSEIEKLVDVPSATLNIVVGVACCAIAIVGVVLAKKRHNKALAKSRGPASDANSSIVML
ncbi:unnamed protein product [Phytophthora fragariaefolia]|uniref:Unnamed protein product n=1 Tax=Phytophthora fragariaefolia TaxID=1490495 RepID=A0A9W6XQD0_9STRA|nr:unnamed protein product [Phytophthora fragariaefolia]